MARRRRPGGPLAAARSTARVLDYASFNRAPEQVGQPFGYRTLEHQPRRAVRVGFAVLRDFTSRLAIPPGPHVQQLCESALRFLADSSTADEETLLNFCTFSRYTAALRVLRRTPSFEGCVGNSFRNNGEFPHDEVVLSLAAKMQSCGLEVVSPELAGAGLRNPDIELPRAFRMGFRSLFFEVKERAPDEPRTQPSLRDFIDARIQKCADQIAGRGRGCTGVAWLDLGVMRREELPEDYVASMQRALTRNLGTLHGVALSATMPTFVMKATRGVDGEFLPVFWSHFIPGPNFPKKTRPRFHACFRRAFAPAGGGYNGSDTK